MKKLPVWSMLFISVVQCYAQKNNLFTYHGKPISPRALVPFMPGMEKSDTVRPYITNLSDSTFNVPIIPGHDNGWLRCDYPEFIYGFDTITVWESIEYNVIGTVGDKFILLVYWNGGGNLAFPFVYVVALKDDKILKSVIYSLDRQPDDSMLVEVKIKGNEVVNGAYHYKIPK